MIPDNKHFEKGYAGNYQLKFKKAFLRLLKICCIPFCEPTLFSILT